MRTVLVTGGSRGIGAAVVRRFAAAGDRVIFTYLRSEREARMLSQETGAEAVRADAAVSAQVDAAVKDMVELFDAKEADMTAAMKAQGFSDEEIEAQKMFQRVNDSHGLRDRLASVQGDGADGNAEGSLAFRLGRGVFSKKGAAKRAARESRLTGEIRRVANRTGAASDDDRKS